MKIPYRLFALAASLVLACTFATAATVKGTKINKWRDKEGVVHYGDTVPPEYASQARQELNEQGVPVRDLPRQLTPTEAAAAQRSAAEAEKRQQHDAYLLHSYTKVADIEQLRDERIALIESWMELLRGQIATNEQRLTGLQNRLRSFRPYAVSTNAKRVTDPLAAEVVRGLSERRSMLKQLQKYADDKATQKDSFDEDIDRYKELTEGNRP